MRNKIAVGVLSMMLGGSLLLHQNYQVDLNEKEFYTQVQATEPSVEPTMEGQMESVGDIEEKKIKTSTYFAYGNGCLFVNVEKDGAVGTAEGEQQTATDAASSEMGQQTTTDMATSEPEQDSQGATDAMANTYIASSTELFNACFSEEEKANIAAGASVEIKAFFHNVTEDELTKKQREKLGDAVNDCMADMPYLVFDHFVSIQIEKRDPVTKEWATIKKFNNPIKISLDLNVQTDETKIDYYLIGLKGSSYTVFEDSDEYAETISFGAERSTLYSVCYRPQIEEVQVTPAPDNKGSYWDKMIDRESRCIWHMFMVPFVMLGLIWVAAVNRKKNRLVFMSVIDIIILTMAILGKCWIDWAVFAGTLLVLFGIHAAKVNAGKNKK